MVLYKEIINIVSCTLKWISNSSSLAHCLSNLACSGQNRFFFFLCSGSAPRLPVASHCQATWGYYIHSLSLTVYNCTWFQITLQVVFLNSIARKALRSAHCWLLTTRDQLLISVALKLSYSRSCSWPGAFHLAYAQPVFLTGRVIETKPSLKICLFLKNRFHSHSIYSSIKYLF